LLGEHPEATLSTRVGCLDDETVYEFVYGHLAVEAIDRVDCHLDECVDCRAVVADLAQSGSGRQPGESGVPLERGSMVGRYLVVDVIGQGAMGVVYAAYDPELHRRVAVKVLRSATDDPALTERMLREAQAMARLSHPNVVAIYDVGTVGASVYIGMELVEGQNLRDWLRETRHDWREVREVLAAAGAGLAAAHAADLVHRDFKPDNVVVGDDGRARVTDFGLARGVGDGVSNLEIPDVADASGDRLANTITVTGAMLGTPAYMAPEQLAGEPVTAAADQFAFCVSAYEALYGRRPFDARTIADLREATAAGRIVEPTDTDVPRSVFAVVAKGLAPRVEDRFESMDALLEAWLRQGARPPRAMAGVIAASAVVIAVAIGLVVFAGGGAATESRQAAAVCSAGPEVAGKVWHDARRLRIQEAFDASGRHYAATTMAAFERAANGWRDEWVAAHDATCRATRVTGEQSDVLLDVRMHCLDRRLAAFDALASQLERADARAVDEALTALSSLPPTAECADVESLLAVAPPTADARPKVEALRDRLDEVRSLVATGQYGAAVDLVRPVVVDAAALGYEPAIAEAHLTAALAERGAGALDRAETDAFEGLWAAENARSDREVARAWILLVGLAGEAGRHDHTERRGRHARAAVGRLSAPGRMATSLRSVLGVVHYNAGRYEEAASELEAAFADRLRVHGALSVEVAATHTNLGNVARARGQLDAALEHHEKALEIDTALLGKLHPNVGRHLHNIGGVLRLQNEPEEATRSYEQALSIKEGALGAKHHEVALTHNSLGLVHVDLGRLAEAERHYLVAIELFGAAKHAEEALARNNLGLLLAKRGRHAAALRELEQALLGYERSYGGEHERTRALVEAIARVREEAGQRPGPPPARQPVSASPPPAAGVYAPGQSWD